MENPSHENFANFPFAFSHRNQKQKVQKLKFSKQKKMKIERIPL